MLSKNDIVSAIELGVLASQASQKTEWVGAVEALARLHVVKGQPFSSGELAAHLRTFRRDLRFSVSSVGQYLRDHYENGQFPAYLDEDGDEHEVLQTSRVTEGWSRTPPGQPVFVYCHDAALAQRHAFEVDIPLPGAPLQIEADGLPPVPVQPQAPQPHFQAQAQAQTPLTAYRHSDGRLLIPRATLDAFEASQGHTRGQHLQVWVTVTGTSLSVSLTNNGGNPYMLTSGNRLFVSRPDGDDFPDVKYVVTIAGSILRVTQA